MLNNSKLTLFFISINVLFYLTYLEGNELPRTNASSNDVHHILYLMQTGNTEKALDRYREYSQKIGSHDHELLRQIALILLDRGFRSSEPEVKLLTIFGAGISMDETALYILQEGLNSPYPQLQLISLNFLTRYHNDFADEAINRSMASNELIIRLEAAYHLAEKKSPKAVSQIEALMSKVDPSLTSIFPELYVLVGNADAMKVMRRLLANPDSQTRINTIYCAAKHGRDDLLPKIRTLATHHDIVQQEACAFAFGVLKDEESIPKLIRLAESPTPTVRLTALHALYKLGRHDVQKKIEAMALSQDLFAINVLGEIHGSEETLYKLVSSQNLQVRINAVLALLELQDSRCAVPLCEILLKNPKDLVFTKCSSVGKGLSAWKVIPSAKENFKDNPIAFELSLNMKESILTKAADLNEKIFLEIANVIFETQQNELIPTLVELLENLQTPSAIQLLKKHQQKAGAPLIRNYCNLALYRLQEPGPYAENLKNWITQKQDQDLIRFRPFVPWELRDNDTPYQLTPQDTSTLLIQSFESFIKTRDDAGINILLDAIQHGNATNKYALVGLLIRAAQ